MRELFLIVLVLGAASQALAITEIQFWHSMAGPKGKILDGIVNEFNAVPENQGVFHVHLQYVGSYPEGMNKLRTALLGKKGPAVAQIYDIGTRTMVDSGAVVPLEDFFADDPSLSKETFLPQIRGYYEVDGKLYSLPFATSNPIVYYNAESFRKAGIAGVPKTFAEIEKVALQLSDKKKQLTGITWPLVGWFFEQFVARQGQDLLDHHNGRQGRGVRVNYTSPAGIEAVSFWNRMVKAGSFAHVGRGWEPAAHNFLAGRSAMLITSTSEVFDIAKQAPFEVKTAPIPTKDLAVAGGTVIGGNALWILKKEDKNEEKAAYAFVRYMASLAVQEKWHTSTGYFPIRQDVVEKLEKEGFYAKNPSAWTAIEQLRASAPISATQGALMAVFPEAREHIESAVEKVLAGAMSVEGALTEAKARTEKALARDNAIKTRIVGE